MEAATNVAAAAPSSRRLLIPGHFLAHFSSDSIEEKQVVEWRKKPKSISYIVNI
jgi:hypothetical protein